MGGRLDATNVVEPLASVITPIGIDHTEYLGETIEAIAAEKAGIIHAGSIAVTSNRDSRVLSVLADTAVKAGTSLHRTSAEVVVTTLSSRIDGIRFELRTPVTAYSLESPLAGEHQADNIALAVRTAELITPRLKSISQSSIERGVASVRWRGRLELFHHGGKRVIVDGGHNSHAANAVARFINEHLAPPRTLVFGIMSDKDVERTAEILFPLFHDIVITRPDPDRAVPLDALAEIAAGMGIVAEGFEKPADAIAHALSLEPTAVVICGSLYLAGAAVALFDRIATSSAATTSDIDNSHDSATSV
jgi:dihydrofolate synthase/folylpolyglutamate synthase